MKICKNTNITRIRCDNIEIEFGESKSTTIDTKYIGKDTDYLKNPTVDMPPDDIMLFAATDHFEDALKTRIEGQKKG